MRRRRCAPVAESASRDQPGSLHVAEARLTPYGPGTTQPSDATMRRLPSITALLLCAASQAAAQQHQHDQSPYAGLEGREIKALSEEQLQQLRDGDGMTLALAAELNHYPGPRHVMDLGPALALSVKQQGQVRGIEQAVRGKAVALGITIIEKERQLDQAFAKGSITEDELRDLTREIARLQADLRYVHLSAHLEVRRLLTGEQVARYDELRGTANRHRLIEGRAGASSPSPLPRAPESRRPESSGRWPTSRTGRDNGGCPDRRFGRACWCPPCDPNRRCPQ